MTPNRSYLTPNLKLFSIFSMWAETHTYEEERGSIDLIWTACLKKLILPRFLLKPSGFSSVFGLWVKLCGALVVFSHRLNGSGLGRVLGVFRVREEFRGLRALG